MKKIALVFVLLGAGVVAASAQDSLPSFNLIDQYGVFGIGNTQMTMSSGNTLVTGNVAVGPNSSLDFSGGGVINGNLVVDPTATTNISGGSSASNILTMDLSAAAQQAISDNSILSNETATSMLSSINNSSNVSLNNGISVIDVGSVNMQGGSKLTINGSANDFVVFDVTGAMTVGGGSQMQLSGGITANHVIWNFVGSGQDINFNGNSTVDGTFLAPDRNITVSGGVVNGAVIGSENGQLKLQSGPKVNAQPVPEPSTIALFLPGLLFFWKKKINR